MLYFCNVMDVSLFVQMKRKKTCWDAAGLVRRGGAFGLVEVIIATSFETEGEPTRSQQLQTQTTGVLRWVERGSTSSRASWCPSRWMTRVGSTLRQMETEKVRGSSPKANRDSPKCSLLQRLICAGSGRQCVSEWIRFSWTCPANISSLFLGL